MSAEMAAPVSSRRIVELTTSAGFFRLFLAALVVVSHMSRLHLGVMAVYEFFILSGYWIARMWDTKYAHARWPYLTFLVSRAWRILPMFWILNALAVLVTMTVTRDPIFPQTAILPNIFLFGYASLTGWGTYLPPAWSLDIEMQFYVLAPMLLFIAHRRLFGPLLFALVLVAGSLLLVKNAPPSGGAPFSTVFPYLGFFGIGVAVATKGLRVPDGMAMFVACVFALCVAGLIMGPYRNIIMPSASGNIANEMVAVPLALLLAPVAMWTVRRGSHVWDKPMGDASYILYLVHWPVVVIYGHLVETTGGLFKMGAACIALLTMAVGTWLVWRYVDRPIDGYRAAFVRRQIALSQSADAQGG